jgi:hypothetical protein
LHRNIRKKLYLGGNALLNPTLIKINDANFIQKGARTARWQDTESTYKSH